MTNKIMTEKTGLRYLKDFSIITIGDQKRPNLKWSECQTEKLTETKFSYYYNLPTTKGIGIVTGYDDLEVIDIDTKVFSTQLEMNEFWNEYSQTLKDTIINFDEKFVVYKTKSGGYHILYKSKRVQGNTKIASLKGHKEAIIETRGLGGYVYAYPSNQISTKSYLEIDFISDEDRTSLWRISESYNFIEKTPPLAPKIKKEFKTDGVTPWDDFNNQNDVWSVISDEFEIPRNGQKRDHIIIKRLGTKADNSGYIYKDSDCMFLFSTGTIYPAEELISSYSAYTYKYHNGDYSASTKDLYEQGFGTRVIEKINEIKPTIKEDRPIISDVEFPLEIFPLEIQHYISECHNKLDSNLDYMGVSLMWLISTCVGNSVEVEVKKGWNENGVLWVAVVGKAGIGKTPSINNVIFPLEKANSREIKRYQKAKQDEEYFASLDKKDQMINPEPKPAINSQFIANDITLEALVDLHQESDNAVGVFKDELAGWLKDMNKYRAGSDLEFWLSTWSGKSVNMNRKTAGNSFVDKPFIPVLGGIQPSIFNSFSTDENKENGFMDRMLLSFPESKVELYNDQELDGDLIKWYDDTITSFYDNIKLNLKRDIDGSLEVERYIFSAEAKTEWKRIFNVITNKQNNDDENEYLKSMYPKQKAYIPRFALLIHIFDEYFNLNEISNEISKESILKAEMLSDYFVNNARKIKTESAETNEIKVSFGKAESNIDKLKNIYLADKNFNRSKVAEMLGISRRTIIRWIEKIEKK